MPSPIENKQSKENKQIPVKAIDSSCRTVVNNNNKLKILQEGMNSGVEYWSFGGAWGNSFERVRICTSSGG